MSVPSSVVTKRTSVPDFVPRSSVPDFVPGNYEELFAHYFPYVVYLVTKAGILFQDAEDVAMTILSKFLEKDVLSDYDPEYTNGRGRKALFRTFLSSFVLLYVRHYVDRQWVRGKREAISLDAASESSSPNHDEMGGSDNPLVMFSSLIQHDDVLTVELLHSIRKHLAGSSPLPIERCQLPELFEACVALTESRGGVRTSDLSALMGVSESTIRTRMRLLREEVTKVLAA